MAQTEDAWTPNLTAPLAEALVSAMELAAVLTLAFSISRVTKLFVSAYTSADEMTVKTRTALIQATGVRKVIIQPS